MAVSPTDSGANILEEAYGYTFGYSDQAHLMGLLSISCLAIVIRCSVGAHPHSGMGKPPMFGDYEAQRHWMEVTVNLPVQDWYRNTTENDLQYWGLDYPPLTAYVSWGFGKIAQMVYPRLVELHSSRGEESEEGRIFMRWSVLACDVFLFFPCSLSFIRAIYPEGGARGRARRGAAWTFLLLSPPFILIDHGHFQYNCVAHALVLFSAAMFLKGSKGLPEMMGCVSFCLALLFKQMSLYFALAFFAFLLGRSLQTESTWPQRILRIVSLAIPVLLTFSLVLAPFLTSLESIGHVLHRVFPVKRGLFEDKVANFWCATHLLIKWKSLLPGTLGVRVAAATTSAALTPTVVHCGIRPTKESFLRALSGSALAFFLFSYQVHEKSILLPLLPLTPYFPSLPLTTTTLTLIATNSMYPLLRRDGLSTPYFAFQIALGLLLVGILTRGGGRDGRVVSRVVGAWGVGVGGTLAVGAVSLAHVLEAALPYLQHYYPKLNIFFGRYPDIGVYLYVLVGAGFFMITMGVLFLYDSYSLAVLCCGEEKVKKI
ncbi:hypothetical protein AAMO2058_000587500 [Amorphochlora amoebiformis]